MTVEHLMGSFLLMITEQPHSQLVTRIFVDVLDTSECCDSFLEEVFKIIIQALKQKKVILKNETLQDLQSYT